MDQKREERVLAILNRYREAWAALQTDQDILNKSQIYYDRGWAYLSIARKWPDGSVGVVGPATAVRLRELNRMAIELERKKEERDAAKWSLGVDRDT